MEPEASTSAVSVDHSTDDKQQSTSTSAQTSVPPPKKRMCLNPAKEKEVDKLELTFMKLAEQENEDKRDPDRLYCLSLVLAFQQLNQQQKSLMKIAIEQAFLDVQAPSAQLFPPPPP